MNNPFLNTRLMNQGDIAPGTSGFNYVIESLSYIRSQIIDQIFYEIPIADFMPVDVGEGAYAEEIVQNLTFMSGGSFYDGDVANADNNGRVAQVNAGLSPIRMRTQLWRKGTGWSIFELMRAATANNWDVVESKLKSLKKDWDLGVQETAFLGHPDGSNLVGLLNDSEVTVNNTLLPVSLSAMTESQFTTFIQTVLPTYFANANDTTLPDTLVIPNDDYLGLTAPYTGSFPVISKIEYLSNALSKATDNPDFKIMGLSYAQATRNAGRGLNENRYVLYKKNPETLKMAIPIDFTMLEADTTNKFNWQQLAYGQYSGCLINRKREVLYMDRQ